MITEKCSDLLRTHIFPRTRELPKFPISPKPLFLSKNRLRNPPKPVLKQNKKLCTYAQKKSLHICKVFGKKKVVEFSEDDVLIKNLKRGYTKFAGDKLVSWNADLKTGDLRLRRGLRLISFINLTERACKEEMQEIATKGTTGVPAGGEGMGGTGGASGMFPATTAASHSASLLPTFFMGPSLIEPFTTNIRLCGKLETEGRIGRAFLRFP
ncbi:hypothetical protein LXL04_020152 [Taraxacum kok-saghyz]